MASLWLPAPTRSAPPPPSSYNNNAKQARQQPQNENQNERQITTKGNKTPHSPAAKASTAPSYEQRCSAAKEFSKLRTPEERKRYQSQHGPLFVPRRLADFDDGGAFPEIHVAQYPRNMGNPHLARRQRQQNASTGSAGGSGGGSGGTSSALVPAGVNGGGGFVKNVEVDADGKVSYDAIVTGGTNSDKKVYTRHADMRGSEPKPEDVALPTEEEERATTERTAAALNAIVSAQTSLAKPTGSAMVNAESARDLASKTQFIQYEPDPNAPGYNPQTAKQRIIQMVPAQIDPMAPPKHMHKKAPRGPAEDPVPVLHAPPKKLTKEEADAWKIPACVSNWKNTRGYTIPLDKRLAADGRGLRDDKTINPNFATLSESLYVAERQAREEVRMRATVQRRLVEERKERREAELRDLANKARMERTAASAVGHAQANPPSRPAATASGPAREDQDQDRSPDDAHRRSSNKVDSYSEEQEEEQVAAQQRERLRMERKRERERELRLENSKMAHKKERRLEDERDVSEKIALGMQSGAGAGTVGGSVDTRLYNQSAGLDSGFGADDEYNAYSKPLFDRDEAAKSIYKPTASAATAASGADDGDADEQYKKLLKGATAKFQPDRGFAGADGGAASSAAGPRQEPVQFEKGRD